MQTETIIKGSAAIARITELKVGDVFKRLEKSSYGSEDELYFGIVTDVLYDGTDAAITACEFKPTYQDLDVKFRTWSGGRDLILFPATPGELEAFLGDLKTDVARNIERKKNELLEAEGKQRKLEDIINGAFAKRLAAPSFSDQPLAELDEVLS